MPLSDAVLSAIYKKDIHRLNELIAAGADINDVDGDGRTPLMHAVLDSDPDPFFVRGLLENGAAPDAADGLQHWTALHFAAQANATAIVRLLLETGASVDPQDVFGNTPLWRSIMAPIPSADMVALLLRAGADPTLRNRHGVSPLALAKTRGLRDLQRQLSPSSSEGA